MKRKTIHRESLLNFHPVRHVFEDNCVTIKKRGVDARWYYNEEISETVSGFNPLRSTIYVAKHSHLEEWLENKEKSARKYNTYNNKLVSEVLFLAHDYLHVWAFNWIRKLVPKLGIGEKKITKKNIEDLVFCHLITEAVATVGLDYWYMCVIDADKICPIGVNFDGLTVSYRYQNEEEYRKFYPNLRVQTPEFFEKIATFYCTGEFLGFGKGDLDQSPVIFEWLSHELAYGENQRVFVRNWYSYLSNEDILYSEEELKSKIDVSKAWEKKLVKKLGLLLWDKIKNNTVHSPGLNIDRDRCWKSNHKKPLDYKFINYNVVKKTNPKYQGKPSDSDNFNFWLKQFLAQHDFGKVDDQILRILSLIKEKNDPQLIQYLFRNHKRLRSERGEPRDLFLLN